MVHRVRITSIAWQKVFVPYASPHVWGGGRRPGPTRLVVTLHTDTGRVGYGETQCLLEFIEPVLARTIVPIAIGSDPHDVEHLDRKVEGAGVSHH
ncbi:MAG: hypothetical protein EXR45_02825 [Chloroflexi bacterium]|nr:hypothetical protein [Chloroflexota bacterium]